MKEGRKTECAGMEGGKGRGKEVKWNIKKQFGRSLRGNKYYVKKRGREAEDQRSRLLLSSKKGKLKE